VTLFGNNKPVLEIKGLLVGQFDPKVDGFYKNVMPFRFDVKKNRTIHVSIRSDAPVDAAIVDGKGATASHVDRLTSSETDVHTGNSREMSLVLGVYPGEKATVDAEIRMDKK
jgi:hypothetical protein